MIQRLRRKDFVTLSLPGFGCPVPARFDASKEAYCDWLLGELRRRAGKVAAELEAHWS